MRPIFLIFPLLANVALAQTKAPDASKAPAPRFEEKFALEDHDVVAFLGGASMVKQVESGWLESFLTHAAAGRAISFRDLSWQADTVYLRQRPRNFGTQLDMLERVGATVVVAAFGQMEVMDGVGRLADFIAAYEALLDEDVAPRTEKIVLVTPFPFAKSDNPHLPDLTAHNEAVTAYATAIVELANRRGRLTIDLSRMDTRGLTEDGLQLTPEGQQRWAVAAARQLLGEPAAILPPNWDNVHREIQRKNVLWRRHWRPTNWAFLYGNRQTQPSSHDHRPGHPRWFPLEIDAILPLINKAEAEILALQSRSKP